MDNFVGFARFVGLIQFAGLAQFVSPTYIRLDDC